MIGVKMVKLSDVVKITSGFAFKSKLFTNNPKDMPLIRIRDIKKGFTNTFYNGNYSEDYLVKKGDILIGMDGEFNLSKWKSQNALLNQRVCKVESISKDLNNNFLLRVLPKKLKEIEDKTSFVTVKHLSVKTIKDIDIPLPTLEDQKRIVKKLDEADLLRKKRKQSIALLDDYLKAVFLEMFSPSSQSFDQWDDVKMQDLAKKEKGSMRTGPFGSDLKHSEFVDEGIAVIGIDNAVQNKFAWDQRRYITEEKYEKLKRYTLFPNDVIVTIMGTTGRSAVIPEDIPLCINTKHLAAITLDRELANPYFISYSIHSNPLIVDQINRKNRGAIMAGLNLGIIKDLKLKRPPIELQNRFADILKQVETLKQSMLTQSKELDTNFNALMQDVFKTQKANNC